jgi:hypothetical protein
MVFSDSAGSNLPVSVARFRIHECHPENWVIFWQRLMAGFVRTPIKLSVVHTHKFLQILWFWEIECHADTVSDSVRARIDVFRQILSTIFLVLCLLSSHSLEGFMWIRWSRFMANWYLSSRRVAIAIRTDRDQTWGMTALSIVAARWWSDWTIFWSPRSDLSRSRWWRSVTRDWDHSTYWRTVSESLTRLFLTRNWAGPFDLTHSSNLSSRRIQKLPGRVSSSDPSAESINSISSNGFSCDEELSDWRVADLDLQILFMSKFVNQARQICWRILGRGRGAPNDNMNKRIWSSVALDSWMRIHRTEYKCWNDRQIKLCCQKCLVSEFEYFDFLCSEFPWASENCVIG